MQVNTLLLLLFSGNKKHWIIQFTLPFRFWEAVALKFLSPHHQYKSPFTFLVLWPHFTFTIHSPSLLYASTVLFCYSSWICPFYGTATRPCRNLLQLLCALYISDLIQDELLYASSECVCCLDFYSACTKSPRPYVHLYFSLEENRGTFWETN